MQRSKSLGSARATALWGRYAWLKLGSVFTAYARIASCRDYWGFYQN
jgi:hypothetical protein